MSKPWEQMDSRERDVMVAEARGWIVDFGRHGPSHLVTTNPKDDNDNWRSLPHYTTDHNAVAEVRAEIARRGLQGPFSWHLWSILDYPLQNNTMPFQIVDTPPEQQCRAALRAMGVEV